MTFRTLHIVITTYRRFFGAESAYFSVWKPNNSCCSTLATTTFPSRLAALLPVENERQSSRITSIHSERWQSKHSNRVRLQVQKCKCTLTITLRARAILTNHGLRRCLWHVHAWRGRGGRGNKIKTSHSVKQNYGLELAGILVGIGRLGSVRTVIFESIHCTSPKLFVIQGRQ